MVIGILIVYAITSVCMAIAFATMRILDPDTKAVWDARSTKERALQWLAATFLCIAWPVVAAGFICFVAYVMLVCLIAHKTNADWAKRLADKFE